MKRLSLLGTLLILSACGRQQGPLDLESVLGHRPDELIERWGEPTQHHPDPGVPGKFGFATWENVEGVRVFVVFTRGKVSWVTYRFEAMEPFDAAAAFEMIGVSPDPGEATDLPSEPGAKRWEPFGQWRRLTINPASKLIAAGRDPLRIPPEQPEGQVSPGA